MGLQHVKPHKGVYNRARAPEIVFIPISELLGKEPKATFGLIGSDREDEEVASLKIQEFAAKLSV